MKLAAFIVYYRQFLFAFIFALLFLLVLLNINTEANANSASTVIDYYLIDRTEQPASELIGNQQFIKSISSYDFYITRNNAIYAASNCKLPFNSVMKFIDESEKTFNTLRNNFGSKIIPIIVINDGTNLNYVNGNRIYINSNAVANKNTMIAWLYFVHLSGMSASDVSTLSLCEFSVMFNNNYSLYDYDLITDWHNLTSSIYLDTTEADLDFLKLDIPLAEYSYFQDISMQRAKLVYSRFYNFLCNNIGVKKFCELLSETDFRFISHPDYQDYVNFWLRSTKPDCSFAINDFLKNYSFSMSQNDYISIAGGRDFSIQFTKRELTFDDFIYTLKEFDDSIKRCKENLFGSEFYETTVGKAPTFRIFKTKASLDSKRNTSSGVVLMLIDDFSVKYQDLIIYDNLINRSHLSRLNTIFDGFYSGYFYFDNNSAYLKRLMDTQAVSESLYSPNLLVTYEKASGKKYSTGDTLNKDIIFDSISLLQVFETGSGELLFPGKSDVSGFINYLVNNFGNDKLLSLYDTSNTFESTYGKDYDTLTKDYISELKINYPFAFE